MAITESTYHGFHPLSLSRPHMEALPSVLIDKDQIRKWAQKSGKPGPQARSPTARNTWSQASHSARYSSASPFHLTGPLLASEWPPSWMCVEGSSGKFSCLGEHLPSWGRSLWFTAVSGIGALDSLFTLSPIHCDKKPLSPVNQERKTPLQSGCDKGEPQAPLQSKVSAHKQTAAGIRSICIYVIKIRAGHHTGFSSSKIWVVSGVAFCFIS